MRRAIQLILAGLFAFAFASAQEVSTGDKGTTQEYIRKKYTIFFPASVSEVVEDYKGNGRTVETMISDLNKTLEMEGTIPDSLTIFAATSPEGSEEMNKRLAILRAQKTRDLLVQKFPQFSPEKIKVISQANDWSGMALTMRRDTTFRFRDFLLKLLTNDNIKNKDSEIRQKHPQIYAAIRDKLFDNMRTASITINVIRTKTNVDEFVDEEVVVEQKVEQVAPVATPVVVVAPPVQEPVIVVEPQPEPQPEPVKEKKPFYMAIKNNMLYDAAIVPNMGAEFYLGKNFSVAGNWMYSWWKKDKSAWYWRTYGGDLAVRYWLGKAAKEKPLTGHHVGLYGQMITYDFEVGNKGVLADRWSWSVGAEYGYSLPVAYRLNIDFTVGFGYHWGVFEEYLPIDGHYVWQATKKRQYIGPTKAEISLVWLIGHGNWNVNKKKNR